MKKINVETKQEQTEISSKLALGKIKKVSKPKDSAFDLVPFLIVECPFCGNVEKYFLFESVELNFDFKFLEENVECSKCVKNYGITKKDVFSALANCTQYEL